MSRSSRTKIYQLNNRSHISYVRRIFGFVKKKCKYVIYSRISDCFYRKHIRKSKARKKNYKSVHPWVLWKFISRHVLRRYFVSRENWGVLYSSHGNGTTRQVEYRATKAEWTIWRNGLWYKRKSIAILFSSCFVFLEPHSKSSNYTQNNFTFWSFMIQGFMMCIHAVPISVGNFQIWIYNLTP